MQNDRLSILFARYYSLLFVFGFVLIPVLAVLAPILMHAGIEIPARIIYYAFALVCHQLPYRSFFLYGAQLVYPLESAGFPQAGMPFEKALEVFGLSLNSPRLFFGNEMMGYKTALCQRDFAIYISIALFCLIYFFSGNRIPQLRWFIWVMIGIIPIGLDGFSQLLSRLLPDFLVLRESTPTLRILTGFLFGFTTSWFVFPFLSANLKAGK